MRYNVDKIREATELLGRITPKGEDPRKVARTYDIDRQSLGGAPVFCVLTKTEWRGVFLMASTLSGYKS